MKRALLLLVSSVYTGVQEASEDLDVPTLSVDGARDVTAEGFAFLELATPRDTYFVHEPIPLSLRFGFEERFFRDNLVSLFRRELDVPVQVQASWLRDLPGELDPPASGRVRQSFALDDRVAYAERVDGPRPDGRRFAALEIERSYLPTEAGELVISRPLLRFAYGTRFREDFGSGRVAVDRQDAFVRGGELTLTIQALPDEGRPPEFSGAVGRFSIEAEADPRDLRLGESLKLVLRIEGPGDPKLFGPPRLDGLEGFRDYGRIDDEGRTVRTVTYDLAPAHERVDEVPPIPFTFFDPDPPAGYRPVQTRPTTILSLSQAPPISLMPPTSAPAMVRRRPSSSGGRVMGTYLPSQDRGTFTRPPKTRH